MQASLINHLLQGLLTLSKYAFDQQDLAIAREASRCLANAMLLNESCRQTFLDLGYADKAVKRLEEVTSPLHCKLP